MRCPIESRVDLHSKGLRSHFGAAVELLERQYAKLVFVNGGRRSSVHTVILRTSVPDTAVNNSSILILTYGIHAYVVTAGRGDCTCVPDACDLHTGQLSPALVATPVRSANNEFAFWHLLTEPERTE